MTIGYQVFGHDNDSYMLGEETRPASSTKERKFYDWRFTLSGMQHPATCESCGRKIDTNYINQDFKLVKKQMDISTAYDGYMIVSSRFRQFCEDRQTPHVEFIELPSEPNFFWLRITRILKVDTDQSQGLRLQLPCDKCNQYAGVFGTGKLQFHNVYSHVPNGFSCTDLEFGQAHEQSPLVIIDSSLAIAMKNEKFRGISYGRIGA